MIEQFRCMGLIKEADRITTQAPDRGTGEVCWPLDYWRRWSCSLSRARADDRRLRCWRARPERGRAVRRRISLRQQRAGVVPGLPSNLPRSL